MVYGGLYGLGMPTKRKVFFSFHYADIMRVNVVRNSGEFALNALTAGRHVEGFYDRSLWEKKKLESEDALRRMIRQGVKNTSAICVLIGTETWARPWVRYEIARSLINNKGLLGVHINSINHHLPPRLPHESGYNPLEIMGIGRINGRYYVCERLLIGDKWQWCRYVRHQDPISVPRYLRAPQEGFVTKLSESAMVYDWANNGAKNIGWWIDAAAQQVGR